MSHHKNRHLPCEAREFKKVELDQRADIQNPSDGITEQTWPFDLEGNKRSQDLNVGYENLQSSVGVRLLLGL